MDKTISKVKKLISKLKKFYRIEKVIVFGSRIRGDNLKYSDIDIILVSDDFSAIPFPERATRIYDFWDDALSLEVLCYTTEEFNKKKNMIGIVQEAVKEGIIIE